MRAALAAAAAGHYVFEVYPRSKLPAVDDWESAATRDADEIRRRWASRPWNIGIATGPSGLHVLDLDAAHEQEPDKPWTGATHGRDVLARLAETAGQPYPSDTYTVASPGGIHLYFRAPADRELRSTVGTIGWRIDSRGAGGFIIAAGSVRAEGYYRARNRAAIAPLPQWLVQLCTPAPPPDPPEPLQLPTGRARAYLESIIAGETGDVRQASTGHRHHTLLRAARILGELVGGGELSYQDAHAALYAAAAVHIGRDHFTDNEATRTITDGLNYGQRRPRWISDQLG